MIHRLLAAAALCLFTVAASAQVAPPPAPLKTPPALPELSSLAGLSPYELARGYLGSTAAVPAAQAAQQGLGIANLGLDGVEYRVDASNAADFLKLLQARAAVYAKAIAARGLKMLDGQYLFTAGPGCKGEKFDPRLLFSGNRAADGSPLMASTARILQSGIETNLLVTFNRGREVVGELLSGVTVEDELVFTRVMGNGFSIYGMIKGDRIELELDPDEVKNSIGAEQGTAADWQALGTCVFTLTRR